MKKIKNISIIVYVLLFTYNITLLSSLHKFFLFELHLKLCIVSSINIYVNEFQMILNSPVLLVFLMLCSKRIFAELVVECPDKLF